MGVMCIRVYGYNTKIIVPSPKACVPNAECQNSNNVYHTMSQFTECKTTQNPLQNRGELTSTELLEEYRQMCHRLTDVWATGSMVINLNVMTI